MRFQDWDVLLFPKGSGVPMQEFHTKCYALKESEHDALGLIRSSSGLLNCE